ncbi:MAG: selenocysteine-specific translation elongation factor [Acidobacteria bacterium]|nr:selenocysteine-specific translation elongation factor [Acidobacteriota bacterium]
MKNVIVGTAGHIDHGKSALVRSLTGTDPDRLEEEKRRGITIDIGFATLDLNSYRLGFVDVPGHERFVKNMLAGIGGIDLVLFVVAADESIQPQTREHFDICRLLEVPRGIVAVTKADLVEPEIMGLVKLEVEEFVAGSFLEGAPIVAVSSRTGEGLDHLKEELRRVAEQVPAKDSSRYFRLPIDRAFVMKGFGPVVTGTLVSGMIRKETEVEAHPLGKRLRVRGIQVHNQPVEAAYAGQRTALNLAGIEGGELIRGMTLTESDRFQPTHRVDCLLHLLPSAPPLKDGTLVHFHSGTAELVAKTILLDEPASGGSERRLEPGQSAYVRFRLRNPALLLMGDHFIIRQLSPIITIGGGRVLDNWVPRRLVPARSPSREESKKFLQVLEKGTREEILLHLLRRNTGGCVEEDDLIAHTGWLPEEFRQAATLLQAAGKVAILRESPLRMAESAVLDRMQSAALHALEGFHKQNPLLPGVSKEALRSKIFPRANPFLIEAVLKELEEKKQIVAAGETVHLQTHQIVLKEEEEQAKLQITNAFEQAGLTVPSVKEVLGKLPVERQRAEKILRILIRENVLVKVSEELVFHTGALAKLRGLLAEYKAKSDRITVATFKDLTQISRKYAIPLLEYLDRERVTRRVGDERILL